MFAELLFSLFKSIEMTPELLKERNLDREFVIKTSRSGGPGGQNVNKVSTKVELRFNIALSQLLSVDEKTLLSEKLKNRINNDGELIIVSQSERTQGKNRYDAEEKFYAILAKALTLQKSRKPTSPSFASKLSRLQTKKKHGALKKGRNSPENPEDT